MHVKSLKEKNTIPHQYLEMKTWVLKLLSSDTQEAEAPP